MELSYRNAIGRRMVNMVSNVKDFEIHLAECELFTMKGDQRDTRIYCEKGAFWLTQEGDPSDYVVSAGQTMTINRSGNIVIQAVPAGVLHVISTPALN